MILFAVHLLDGFLPDLWCLTGYVLALALAVLGCFRLRDDEIPRVALVTAAFFVATAIHIKVPPSSVHLVLNGLVGVILGWRAGLAIMIGLMFQFAFLGHGGIKTLGINAVLMTLPAFAVGVVFRVLLARFRILTTPAAISLLGGLLGFTTVLATILLQTVLLWLAGDQLPVAPLLWFGFHLPLAIIDGLILAFSIGFLAKVKPDMLGMKALNDGFSVRHG